jgi:hypothetical protein
VCSSDLSAIWVPLVNNDAKTAGLPILSWQSEATPYIMQGDGLTADTAYQITNVGQLQTMAYGLDKYYQLANNINADISGYNTGVGFNPVGFTTFVPTSHFTELDPNPTNPFTGTFEGNGKTISNLYVNKTTNYAGLFGITVGATISDVGVVGSGSYFMSPAYVGPLVGYAKDSTITNAYSTVSLNVTDPNWESHWFFGGLIGQATNSQVSRSYTTGNITAIGEVGGLIAQMTGGSLSDSYTTGNVHSVRDYAGGLVSIAQGDTVISNSYTTGRVTAVYRDVGGIAGGLLDTASVVNSYAVGTVSGGTIDIGSLVGLKTENATVTNSYFTDATRNNGYGTLETNGESAFYASTHAVYSMGEANQWDIFNPVWDMYAN